MTFTTYAPGERVTVRSNGHLPIVKSGDPAVVVGELPNGRLSIMVLSDVMHAPIAVWPSEIARTFNNDGDYQEAMRAIDAIQALTARVNAISARHGADPLAAASSQ